MSALKDNLKSNPRIGVYRIEEEIGAGAMGKVYRAVHETLGKAVALKIVHADDPTGEVAARFLQEGIAASRVRHPNVVEILDAGKHEETAFLAMQLLDGETMAECLSRQGRLPQTYAVDLILPVCAALSAAHEAGVLHRDLKPANIFLSDVGRGDPEPILLDFGISKILGPVDPELTQNPRFLGSPLYIAPEQADGGPGSPRSDQYSLALTLYEALLGVRPFAKYSSSLIQLLRHVAEGHIRPPRELDASIPDDLDATISRALSTNPRERFSTVREFGAALLPFASQARRTLWQQSFVNAERTMTSANAPVSDSTRSSRKVQVSVDSVPSTEPTVPDVSPPGDPDDGGDFLTHSALFGDTDADSIHSDFERSSISRRDPYSRIESERTSETWGELDRTTAPSPEGKAPEPRSSSPQSEDKGRRLIVALAALALGLALLIALRPWAERAPETFHVDVEVSPSSARIIVDGTPVGKGRFQTEYPVDGRVHRVRFEEAGYEPQTVVFQDRAPVGSIELSRLDVGPPTAPGEVPEPETKLSPAHGATGADSTADDPTESSPEPRAPSNTRALRPVTEAPAPVPQEGAPSSSSSEERGREDASEAPSPPPPQTAPEGAGSSRPSLHTGNLDPWAK